MGNERDCTGMKLATPEFQTEYCTWARPLKTGMCLCRRLLTQFHECQSQCVCVGWRAFESYVMIKGGESVMSAFLFVCWSDQCVISHSPSPPNKMHTRVHKDTLVARKKAFSLQLIARSALSSHQVVYCPMASQHTHTHTDLCTHTHAHDRVCTCRIAAAQWWTAGVGPVKTLESASGHRHSVRSCFILSFLLPCPNSLWLPNTLVTNCQLSCGMVLWCTEPWFLMPESANRLRSRPCRGTDGAWFICFRWISCLWLSHFLPL